MANNEELILNVETNNPYVIGAIAYVEQLENGAKITIVDKNGTTVATVYDGTDGTNGKGIASVTLNSDYTLTFLYTDGTTTTTTSVRGATGDSGVYVGDIEPSDPDVNVWVDTEGDPYPMDEEIAVAVDGWITDHPEYVTTVEDGAITVPKFAASVVDATLTQTGHPADAKATGDAITADRTRLTAVEGEADSLDARITNLAQLTDGSTTGDAELIDARVVGSTTYSTLHQAIDTEFTNVKSELNKTDSGLDAYGIRLNYYTDSGKQTGYRVRTDNGDLSGQTGMDASGYIPVKANSEYDLNYSYYSSASYGMAFYDSSKTFISGIKQSASTSSSETVHFKFTTPANCAFIRITIFQSYTTPIVLLNVTNADIVRESEKSIGLIEDALNNAGVRYNYYRGGRTAESRVRTDNGELAYQYDHDASEFVKVDAQTKYELSFSYYSSGNYGIAFYNNSKTFISGAKQSNTNTSSATTPFTFTTPANCAYLRFSIPQSLTNPITLFNITNNDVGEGVQKANSAIDNGTFTFEQIGITVSAGIRTELSSALNTDSASYVHAEITVAEGEIYTVRGVSYRYGFPCWILLDADGNVLSFSSYAGQTTDLVKTERVYITEKAHTLWINNNSTLTNISVKKAVPAVIDSGLRGKKIVWFGTSIPAGNTGAGGANSYSYPALIGEMIGATVYNEAIGSSRVRGGSYHHISADDPMGWAGMSSIGVMLSLSLSAAEKQAIADEWETKWKNIIGNPSLVDMDNIDTYKASSWDSILPKYLTGGSVGQCDVYVFDHGYNEGVTSYGFTDLLDEPSTDDDRTYWFGAMDYIIRKIVSDNPKAKIFIVGHYNGTGSQSYNTDAWKCYHVIEAQEAYAKRWGANIIKTWELLNLSTQKITVNNEQVTVIAARYPDGVHPASDTTGEELQRYANALVTYFK